MKFMKETLCELLKEDQKKQLGNNNEAKMTLYDALPRKEYGRVFMCTAKEIWHTLIITHQGNSQVNNYKIDLLTQEYEKFSILNEETINSGFTRFNAIRAKVAAIEEAKDLATLPLDERNDNLKVHQMVLDNDGIASKTTKEKVKSLSLKAKSLGVIDSGGDNQFGNGTNRFGRCRKNNFGNKGGESSKQKGACYNCGVEGHFVSECKKPKENKVLPDERGVIMKTTMNLKTMQRVSWLSTLKMYNLNL
nr:hypothetical protein [Tanacetum cinerariifolium]